LYKSFSGNRKPNFETVLKTISELGLKVSISIKDDAINDNAELLKKLAA
jgi:DNA-binding phage protein